MGALQPADASGFHPLLHLLDLGQKAHPHALHEEQPLLPGQGKDLLRLAGVQHHALFAKDVLASFEKTFGDRKVEGITYDDGNCINA